MKCIYCGNEMLDNTLFCSFCGKKYENRVGSNEEPKESKSWRVFGKIGLILGIINIINGGLGFLLSFNLISAVFGVYPMLFAVGMGIPGIIFSALGKNSSEYKSNRSLILNIIGFVLGGIAVIIFIILLINNIRNS